MGPSHDVRGGAPGNWHAVRPRRRLPVTVCAAPPLPLWRRGCPIPQSGRNYPVYQSSLSFDVTRSDQPRSAEERAKILEKPGFGLHFTDHMVAVRWDKDTGWHNAAVTPYGPISLDPAAAVLHYGQEIFEGIKAYRHADGSVWTFRPQANAARLQRSARRLVLPELPADIFVESLKQLVALDKDWVSDADEASLYFRPFMIGDEAFLG